MWKGLLKSFLYPFIIVAVFFLSGVFAPLIEEEVEVLANLLLSDSSSMKNIVIVDINEAVDNTNTVNTQTLVSLVSKLITAEAKAVILDTVVEIPELATLNNIFQTVNVNRIAFPSTGEIIGDKQLLSKLTYNLDQSGKESGISEISIRPIKNIVGDGGGFVNIFSRRDKKVRYFELFRIVNNTFVFSLPLKVFYKINGYSDISINDNQLRLSKGSNLTRISIPLYRGDDIRLNPYYKLNSIKTFSISKISGYTDFANIRNKIVIVSDSKNADIKLGSKTKISRARFLALLISNLEDTSMLPIYPWGLSLFMLCLLTAFTSLTVIISPIGIRAIICGSLFVLYILISLISFKYSELYTPLFPVLLSASLSFLYGAIFFKNIKTQKTPIKNKDGIVEDVILLYINIPNIDGLLNTENFSSQDGTEVLYAAKRMLSVFRLLGFVTRGELISSNNKEMFIIWRGIEKKGLSDSIINRLFKSKNTILRILKGINSEYHQYLIPKVSLSLGKIFINFEDNFITGLAVQQLKHLSELNDKYGTFLLSTQEFYEVTNSKNILYPVDLVIDLKGNELKIVGFEWDVYYNIDEVDQIRAVFLD